MIKIGINGAAGRMGRRIVFLIESDPECSIGCAADRIDHPDMGKDIGSLAGMEETGILLKSELSKNVDSVVDFSAPSAALQAAKFCNENKIPFATGTTGLTDDQVTEIKSYAKNIPVLIASNMSIGVNLL